MRPGDRVAVFAGSSPFDATLAWRGLGWLASRYRVVFDRAMFERTGFLAGSDERRRRELQGYLDDPTLAALISVRGGHGITRFAHELDLSGLRERPRWVVGFSDVTALHVETARLGVASIHGPMVAAAGRADAVVRRELVEALEEPGREWALEGLDPWRDGAAEGTLVGGNLTVLHACAAAGRLALPEGCLLLLEDVTERPYRLDRMLATLHAGGHLRRAAGIVLGGFTDCHTGLDGVPAEQVLREWVARLGVPAVAGAPVGHGVRNVPVMLGARHRIVEGRLVRG